MYRGVFVKANRKKIVPVVFP